MKAFIWDVDGTLIDSYPTIVESLYLVYHEIGIELNKEEILLDSITESVSSYIDKLEERYHIPFDSLRDRYNALKNERLLSIKEMPNASKILEILKNEGAIHFVYTHRGKSTEPLLKNLKIYQYFDEIVCELNGYKRKPDPEGINYLVNKYHLDKDNTYYVGDRTIDIECACNAHINSIMYLPSQSVAIPSGKETYIVHDLLDIKDVL